MGVLLAVGGIMGLSRIKFLNGHGKLSGEFGKLFGSDRNGVMLVLPVSGCGYAQDTSEARLTEFPGFPDFAQP